MPPDFMSSSGSSSKRYSSAVHHDGGAAFAGRLPLHKKTGDGRGLHAAHAFELTAALAIEKLSLIAEHSQRRHAAVERDLVVLGDVEIFIHMTDIDVNEHIVRLKKRKVLRVV